jgi:hypothetical protein
MGRQWQEFSPILAVWLVSVSYWHRHLVVGILVGILVDTVPFWQEPSFDDLVGTPFLNNLVGTPGGWYFGWYFWLWNNHVCRVFLASHFSL